MSAEFPLLRDQMEAEILKCRPDVQPDAIDGLKRYIYRFAQMLCYHGDVEPRHPDDMLHFDGGRDERSGQLGWQLKPGIILTCEVDLLLAGRDPSEIHLHDWKTGHKHWTMGDIRSSFQFGTFYPWIVLSNYPNVQQCHVWTHMTRLCEQVTATFRREDMPQMEQRLRSAVDIYESKERPAWPQLGKCEHCPAVLICEAAEGKPVEFFARSPDGYLSCYIAVKARAAEMKKTLDDHVRQNGDLKFDDVCYGQEQKKAPSRFSAATYKPEKGIGDDRREDQVASHDAANG
jgi:hypothetical protein